MTIESITDSLKSEIKNRLGFHAFLLPQKATNNTAHIDLLFQSVEGNGEGSEKLTFSAEYRTAGTHAKWLTETIRISRKISLMNKSDTPYMPFECDGERLRAYWTRSGKAGWVYPNEDESSMPAEYVIPYSVEIDIPTRLITED
ncbi:MAG: hypothetical protein J6I53_12435 [Treponema sp.]|nr:hypothetical protein [Treponema sp.]